MRLKLLLLLLLLPSTAFAQDAFNGAFGAGKNADGFRGGTVCFVTNTNDSGAGSLRNCVDTAGSRIIIFRVGGTIALSSPLILNGSEGNVYIAGQSAPGGIQVTCKAATITGSEGGSCLEIQNVSNVLIRYVRFRNGRNTNYTDYATHGQAIDTIQIRDSEDIYIDHVSMGWANDEVIDIGGKNSVDNHSLRVTVANSIIHESLTYGHFAACMLVWSHTPGTAVDYTVARNYFVGCIDRSPEVKVQEFEFFNNMLLGGAGKRQTTTYRGGVHADHWNNNYKGFASQNKYIRGRDNTTAMEDLDTGPFGAPILNMLGNITKVGSPEDQQDMVRWTTSGGDVQMAPPTPTPAGTPGPTFPLGVTDMTVFTLLDAKDLEAQVFPLVGASQYLNDSGAWVSAIDASDARVKRYWNTGDVRTLYDETVVGGFPTITGLAACTDSDSDGMCDTWENNNFGNLSQTASGDNDSDGYTNIEEFLNGDTP